MTHADDEKSPIEHDGSPDAGSPAPDAAAETAGAMGGQPMAPGDSGVVSWLSEGGPPPAAQPPEGEGAAPEQPLGGEPFGDLLPGEAPAESGAEGSQAPPTAGDTFAEAPTEEGQPAAEEEPAGEEPAEEEEKQPGFFGRLAKSDPYMVSLVVAFLALVIGASAMLWEWHSYHWIVAPTEIKKDVRKATSYVLPVTKEWLVARG